MLSLTRVGLNFSTVVFTLHSPDGRGAVIVCK